MNPIWSINHKQQIFSEISSESSAHVVFKCCIVIHLLPAASTVISSPSPGRTSHRYLNASHRKICCLTSSPWPSPSNTNLVWHDFKGTEKNLYFGHKQKPSCKKTIGADNRCEAKGALRSTVMVTPWDLLGRYLWRHCTNFSIWLWVFWTKSKASLGSGKTWTRNELFCNPQVLLAR